MAHALLLALALAADPGDVGPATTHGRLVLSAEAGGGWASDPYLGADMGAGGLAQLTPAARLDLSFTRALKAAAGLSASLSQYPGGDFGSTGFTGGGELRWVGGAAEGLLVLTGDAAKYSAPTPLGSAAGPGVTATAGMLLTPMLRLRKGALSGRLSTTAELRRSRTDTGDVSERALAAHAGLGGAVRRWLVLDASLGAEHVASAAPDFAHRAADVDASVTTATVVRGPELTLDLGAQATRFDTGRGEKLVRVSLEAAQPIGKVELLLSWSASRSDATGGDAPEAVWRRQLWYLGLRGRREVLAW